jgi:hypothetical protein
MAIKELDLIFKNAAAQHFMTCHTDPMAQSMSDIYGFDRCLTVYTGNLHLGIHVGAQTQHYRLRYPILLTVLSGNEGHQQVPRFPRLQAPQEAPCGSAPTYGVMDLTDGAAFGKLIFLASSKAKSITVSRVSAGRTSNK